MSDLLFSLTTSRKFKTFREVVNASGSLFKPIAIQGTPNVALHFIAS